MTPLSIFAPAKVNLFLAITGRRPVVASRGDIGTPSVCAGTAGIGRPDGFHELVSVVAQLDFGDTLSAEVGAGGEGFSLSCNDPDLPIDEDNLVLKAARAFAERTGWKAGVRFRLEKRIPAGAGLGGGSSDAAATLRLLSRSAETNLTPAQLSDIAAQIGSDCPLFLAEGPVIMRGRGEQITPLPDSAVRRMRGRRVLVFKPGFSIATAWAYQQLAAAAPGSYLRGPDAERRIADWVNDSASPLEALLFNNMEPPAFRKYVALPVMLELLRQRFGVAAGMSGSGSACFALLPDTYDAGPVIAAIQDGWGTSAFILQARLS